MQETQNSKSSQKLREEIQQALKDLTHTRSEAKMNKCFEICKTNNQILEARGEKREELKAPPEKTAAAPTNQNPVKPEQKEKPEVFPKVDDPDKIRNSIRNQLKNLGQGGSPKKQDEILDFCLAQNRILKANGFEPEPLNPNSTTKTGGVRNPSKPETTESLENPTKSGEKPNTGNTKGGIGQI